MTVTLSKIYTEGRRRGTKSIRTAGGTPPPPPPATPQECVRRAQGPQRSPTTLGTGQHGAFPELPHPLTAGKPHFTPEVAVPAPRASQPHARGFADPLPAHAQARPGSASPPTASPPTASGSAATPGLHRPRKGAHSPVPSQGRAPRPPPPSVAESFPHNLPTEGRTAGGTGGRAAASFRAPGEGSAGTAHLAPAATPPISASEPGWGLGGKRGLPGGLKVREGGWGRDAGSRLFSPQPRLPQPGQGPRTLAHFLTVSQSLWVALTPTHTHTRSHTHSFPHTLTHSHPATPRSLTRPAYARARPRLHCAHDAGGGCPALP